MAAPALSEFAQQVEALRAARMPVKVGVIVPTCNRPDLLRACVLQLLAQSRVPDIVCVHQNGVSDSYQWATADMQTPARIAWLHTRAQLPQRSWYSIPLRYLVEHGCTHFFWADHDDIYLRQHVELGMEDLKSHDFSVSPRCGILFTRGAEFRYDPEVKFTSHAPGGLNSSMCFGRPFALQLLADLEADSPHAYAHDVVAYVTMPKFRCHISGRSTSVYHVHPGAHSAASWLPAAFGEAGGSA